MVRTPLDPCCTTAHWNADGVHGLRLELDHLLIQHSVDICLFNETQFRLGEAFGFANFVCNSTDWITGHGRAILDVL